MQIGNDGLPGDRVLLLFNAGDEACDFRLPPSFPCTAFRPIFSSVRSDGLCAAGAASMTPSQAHALDPRSFVVLQHHAES